jgi:hypothetical protein
MQQEYSATVLFDTYWEQINLIVGEKDGKVEVFGTAFHIAPNLALTAAHVVEEYAKWGDAEIKSLPQNANLAMSLYLLSVNERNTQLETQTFCEEGSFTQYNIKHVTIPLVTDDIALLILENGKFPKTYPLLDFRPPKVGEELFSMGFPKSIANPVQLRGVENGISIGIDPVITSGYVSEVFPEQHSTTWHPYPGVYVYFRTEGGMSGSPVFSRNTGHIIGLVSSSPNSPDQHGNYQSFIATLAPLLKIELQFGNGNKTKFSERLERLGLTPKNTTDYSFDSETGKPIYCGPSLDELANL